MARKKKTKKKKAKKPPYIMLLPFKGIMKRQLKKKGVKLPNNKLRTVVDLFHKNVVKPHNLEDNFDENIIDDIVKIAREVLTFITSIFKKKKKGEPVGKELSEMADGIASVNESLNKANIDPDKIIDENGNTSDGKKIIPNETGVKIGKASIPLPLIIAGAGIAAYLLIKRK